jgi:hypothetical protein
MDLSNLEEHRIDLAIDWGTWKWAAAYVLCKNDRKITPVRPLLIDDSTYEVRMAATWIDERLVQGRELQNRTDNDEILSDSVIDFFKLPLYQGPETAAVSDRVDTLLKQIPGDKTLDLLISDHLRAVIEVIKRALLESPLKRNFGASELQNLVERMRVRITVPAIWRPDARRRMQAAAKNAGLVFVALASEPQCALAYLIEQEKRNKIDFGRQPGAGDHILVADLGCGTADFVVYQLQNIISVDSRMKAVTGSSGGVCGSVKVDELLYHSLLVREGRQWHISAIKKLGVTERDFTRRAMIAVEKAKRDFGGNDQITAGVISGVKRTYVPFHLESQEIYGAMDTVISEITKYMDKDVEDTHPVLIEVTGGFSKSSYLMTALRDRYEPQGIKVIRPNDTDTGECLPVAIGALLRYNNITSSGLPTRYGYAMLQRQVFDEEQHSDSYYTEIDFDDEDRNVKQPWVLPSPYDETIDIVDDRIVNIIDKGSMLAAGQVVTQNLEFRVPCDDPRFSAEFVLLDKKFPNNVMSKVLVKGKMVKGKGREEDKYVFRKGVHPWARVSVPLDEEELKRHGFPVFKTEDGKDWLLYVRVALQLVAEDISIKFDVLKPVIEGKEQENGKRKGKAGTDNTDPFSTEVAFCKTDMVFDATHSEF